MSRPTAGDWMRVIALSGIWGAAFVNIRMALTGFGPLTVAALRIVIGGAALLWLARTAGQRLPPLRDRARWTAILGMAVFSNALPFSLLGWGQQHVTSGFAGLSMAAVPLFTLLLAARFVSGEALTAGRIAGIILGGAGVALLIGPGALLATGADAEAMARLACMGAAFSYAVGAVITRRCPPMPLMALSAATLLVAAALIVPLALLVEGLPGAAPTAAWLSVAYLGVMPTAAATILLVAVATRAGPNFLALSSYQVPVWSLLLGAAIFGEHLPPSFLLALALILAGIAASTVRGRTLRLRRQP